MPRLERGWSRSRCSRSRPFTRWRSPTVRDRTWAVVERHQPADGGEWRVVFETTLDAPYFLKLRKTYTLAPKDYHVGLKLDIQPLPSGRLRSIS